MLGSQAGEKDGVAHLSGARILVVEDEFLLAELIEQMLSDSGAHVVGPASTLEEGLALIETEQFDLALLDANLRGRSVSPLAEALHDRGKPFAFLSGYRKMTDIRTRFPDAPVFEKPTNFETLQIAIAGLLRNRAST